MGVLASEMLAELETVCSWGADTPPSPVRSPNRVTWQDIGRRLNDMSPSSGYGGQRSLWPSAGGLVEQLSLLPEPVDILAAAHLAPYQLEAIYAVGNAATRTTVVASSPGPHMVTLGSLDDDPGPRWAAAGHAYLPAEMRDHLTNDEDERVRAALASTTDDERTLVVLSVDPSELVRAAVAGNRLLNHHIAMRLTADESESVRSALATSSDGRVLLELLEGSRRVQREVLEREDLPEAVQVAAATDGLVDILDILTYWGPMEPAVAAALGDDHVTHDVIHELLQADVDPDLLEWLRATFGSP